MTMTMRHRELVLVRWWRHLLLLAQVLFLWATTTMVVSAGRSQAAFIPRKRTSSQPHHQQQKHRTYYDTPKQRRLLFVTKSPTPETHDDKTTMMDNDTTNSSSWLVRIKNKLPLVSSSSGQDVEGAASNSDKKQDDKKKKQVVQKVVHDITELRHAVFHEKMALKDLGLSPNFTAVSDSNKDLATVNATTASMDQLQNHPVLQLLAERHRTNSTPGHRAKNDTAHLALAIEGGGMRGAVSAGMAGAIASLGFTNAFDSVYGSSAGSIVGAYMISRQMCIDVYTEVLPAAKGMFASKGRVVGNLGIGVVNDLVQRYLYAKEKEDDDEEEENGVYSLGGFTETNTSKAIASSILAAAAATKTVVDQVDRNIKVEDDSESSAITSTTRRWLSSLTSRTTGALSESMPALVSSLRQYLTLTPGMNISFVLDGVMSEQHGLRPFDMESFRRNDAQQPLYAVASTVRNGQLETVAFNSRDGDYFDRYIPLSQTNLTVNGTTAVVRKRTRIVQATKRLVVGAVQLPWVVLRFVPRFLRTFSESFTSLVRSKTDNTNKIKKRQLLRRITADKSPLFRKRLQDTFSWRNRTSATMPTKSSEKKKRKKNADQNKTDAVLVEASSCPSNSGKKGFFACIESSMLVPGAAGKPVKLLRSKHRTTAAADDPTLSVKENEQNANICFDAFCYEPIPYRSAVQNGATHVLALRSRPDGCFIETVPAVYEKLVAPVFFRAHGLNQVVQFFESGGSQYRYLEDVLTLEEGMTVGCHNGNKSQGVAIPPTDILFGTKNDQDIVVDMDTWQKAHMLPVVLPAGTPELPSLTQDKDEVLLAVRNGFAAAFDVLAPFAGLDFDPATVDSKKIAELMFPDGEDDDMYVLENPVAVKGDYILNSINESLDSEGERIARSRFVAWMRRKRRTRQKERRKAKRNPFRAVAVEVEREMPDTKQYAKADSLDWLEAEALLAMLPGFQGGRLSHLSGGLRSDGEVRVEKEDTMSA